MMPVTDVSVTAPAPEATPHPVIPILVSIADPAPITGPEPIPQPGGNCFVSLYGCFTDE
jgi:hypothetical protein